MPTIKDVALRAGVSRSTVSRVMNNQPYVDEEKRKAVKQAMKELGYLPNSSAQRLRGTETRTIAVLVSRIVNPFFSAIVDAMDEVAAEQSYRLILCNTRGSANQELHFLQLLRTKQVDGLILASLVNDWETIAPYTDYGPIVICNEYPRKYDGVPVVTIDQSKAMYEATVHLLKKGYKQIAYCNPITKTESDAVISPLAQDRYLGFCQAMEEAGMHMYGECLFLGHSLEDGRNIFKQMVCLANRPDAILTGSDEVAAGIIAEAKAAGWKIPDDLAIVGFDNQPHATLIEPELTTIHQPVQEMGRAAMERMLALLRKESPPPLATYLEAPLLARKST